MEIMKEAEGLDICDENGECHKEQVKILTDWLDWLTAL